MSDLFRLSIAPEILSWTSTSALLAGAPYKGITALKFEEKRERKLVHGMNKAGKPLGRTSGKYTPGPGSIKMLADSWKVLSTQLALLGAGSYGDAKLPPGVAKGFPIIITYSEPLDPSGITIIGFEDCAIEGTSDDLSEGNDENVVDVSFSCLGIRRNGLTLYSLVRSLSL